MTSHFSGSRSRVSRRKQNRARTPPPVRCKLEDQVKQKSLEFQPQNRPSTLQTKRPRSGSMCPARRPRARVLMAVLRSQTRRAKGRILVLPRHSMDNTTWISTTTFSGPGERLTIIRSFIRQYWSCFCCPLKDDLHVLFIVSLLRRLCGFWP